MDYMVHSERNRLRKDTTVFRRFLGSIFLYFYIIPAFSRAIRKIVIPTISHTVHKKMLDELNAKKKAEREYNRNRTRPRQSA